MLCFLSSALFFFNSLRYVEKGIGLACAKAVAAEGCNDHLVAQDVLQLETAKQELLEIANVEVQLHKEDLSKSESIKALIDVVVKLMC